MISKFDNSQNNNSRTQDELIENLNIYFWVNYKKSLIICLFFWFTSIFKKIKFYIKFINS
jgi:hypothetical protein